MKKIDLGQARQILANVGVMLGLVFLAVETGQNQRALDEQKTLAKLSVPDTQFEAYSRFRHLLLSNPDLQ